VYYFCRTYKDQSKNTCTKHAIKHSKLEAAVLYAIQQQIYIAVHYSSTLDYISSAPLPKSQCRRIEALIEIKERERIKIMGYKQSIYQDWKDGEITHSDYRHMSQDYEQQIAALDGVLDNLHAEQDKLQNDIDAESPCLTAFKKFENIDKLTREILIEFVDHIKVHENGNISIKFKFADQLRRIMECIDGLH